MAELTRWKMADLLPCPFCGSKAEIERYGDSRKSTIYSCTNCGCSLETGEEWGHGRRWNERADRLNEAVLAEREACAKVADREERLREGSAIFACIAIAAVIRARSKADSALGADASTEGAE